MTDDLGASATPKPALVNEAPAGLRPTGFDPARDPERIRKAGFIEGYAAACDDLQYCVTADSGSAKSYDPATVDLERGILHSYAFNLKDGGRHHPLSDYASHTEICSYMRHETIQAFIDEMGLRETDAGAVTERSDRLAWIRDSD